MPIASFTPFSLVEHVHRHEQSLIVSGDDHLGDALSVVHDEILLRQVDEQHAHLTTIVGIDRSRGVEYRDTLLQGQSTAGPHLGLIACWQGNVQSRRDESPLHGFQHDRRIEIGPQVHAGTLRCGILRQWLMTFVHDFDL